MGINALLMDDDDNVVTCVAEVSAGQNVVYQRNHQICTLKAEENIPYCHKIALRDLDTGDAVIKYGELIGKTNQPIKKGYWVSHLNIYSVPRDYASEMTDI